MQKQSGYIVRWILEEMFAQFARFILQPSSASATSPDLNFPFNLWSDHVFLLFNTNTSFINIKPFTHPHTLTHTNTLTNLISHSISYQTIQSTHTHTHPLIVTHTFTTDNKNMMNLNYYLITSFDVKGFPTTYLLL